MTQEFDASAFARRLREAGMPAGTTEVCAAIFGDCVATILATKADVAALEVRIADLRVEIGREADILLEALQKEIAPGRPALTRLEMRTFFSCLQHRVYIQISQLAVWCAVMLAAAVALIVFFNWLL